ncbi:hypothetical protein PAAG_05545 [Paracoccidioides lutzii Pb01]|uniref:Uncharacterized protein n=1 Tax=Paracoccidioides lutzii (strain ATCC MYA-826 / Pb01) TaxID=502779 RepID=C1H452_PARBA|nr:hypothetical protein PAAG_05545 [Paracoccidioides lutzii Pb01]EEH34496.1 hypothetical protein PAAG_05545 [Paracoccidioides lutzii Pb01]
MGDAKVYQGRPAEEDILENAAGEDTAQENWIVPDLPQETPILAVDGFSLPHFSNNFNESMLSSQNLSLVPVFFATGQPPKEWSGDTRRISALSDIHAAVAGRIFEINEIFRLIQSVIDIVNAVYSLSSSYSPSLNQHNDQTSTSRNPHVPPTSHSHVPDRASFLLILS